VNDARFRVVYPLHIGVQNHVENAPARRARNWPGFIHLRLASNGNPQTERLLFVLYDNPSRTELKAAGLLS
jgi:hypothetical protein